MYVYTGLFFVRSYLCAQYWYLLTFSAGFLPVKLLIELLNFSLVNDVAGRVTSGLAMEVDRRLKKSLLGNENYQLGDATKSAISSAVTTYTGKGVCCLD